MRKDFGVKPWLFPQPVLIIGTYDKDGKANAMNAAWGGTYDVDKVVISLSEHKTTANLRLNKAFTLSFGTKNTVSRGATQRKKRIGKCLRADNTQNA